MKRKRMPSRIDKRVFSNTAEGMHPYNLRKNPMRGGIRL